MLAVCVRVLVITKLLRLCNILLVFPHAQEQKRSGPGNLRLFKLISTFKDIYFTHFLTSITVLYWWKVTSPVHQNPGLGLRHSAP